MTEKDLDVAIEMCERIMEFDTRTMQNPVSENGWIFEKVYELLQYLRQFQFATDTNVGDAISRKAAIEIVRKAKDKSEAHRMLIQLPSAQPGWIPTSVKPPEPFKLVLIQDSCGCYELNTYIPPRINPKQYPNGYWGDVDCVDYDYFDVYAWYPFPKEYHPEGEEHG